MPTAAERAVYLDYNATAPVRPAVIEALTAVLAEGGNPSAVHASGRRARLVVEEARRHVAAFLGASPEQVVFTGGGTEANNLAIRGQPSRHLILSAIEHDSIAAFAGVSDFRVDIAGVGGDGIVDLADMEEKLSATGGDGVLVALMLANNETGALQPVAEAAALAHRYGARIHCDAVQAAGKIALDFTALGVDSMAISAHKIGGPQGVGALLLSPVAGIIPQLTGGGQEKGRRSGTENVAGIAGFGVAAGLAGQGLDDFAALAGWRDRLEAEITALCPAARIFAATAPRLANTSSLSMPGVSGELQVMAFDLAGVMISAGSACSSGKVTASGVLRAMGASPAEAGSAIRLSLGWDSREQDVDRFIGAWKDIWQRLGTAGEQKISGIAS